MISTRNWIGIIALLFSLPVSAVDLEISDAWIRVIAQDQENGMVGLTITAPQKARIIAASSPAYTTTEMRRTKSEQKVELAKSIPLSANKPLALGSDNYHLALLGKKQTLKTGEKIPVLLTVQYNDKETKDITFLAQPIRARAGSLPLPIISKSITTPVMTPPNKVHVNAAEPTPTAVPLPQHTPEIEPAKTMAIAEPMPEPVAVAEPVTEPVPMPVAEPVPAPAPISAPIALQVPPEIQLSELPEETPALPVEDCMQYSTETQACDHAGELDDIIRCRKSIATRLSCSKPN
jgi:periplasmic copper chaperone A